MSGRIVYTPERTRQKSASRYNLKIILVFLLAVILLVAGAIFALRYPTWQLAEINVSGARSLSVEEIKSLILQETSGNYAFIIPKTSILLLGEGSIASKLQEKFLKIREINLARELPDKLEVNIVERDFWVILCNDKFTPDNSEDVECVFLDKDGYAFDYAPDSSGSLVVKIKTDFPSLSLGKNIIEEKFAFYLSDLAEKIESGIGSKVIAYEISSLVNGEFRIILNDGFLLILPRGGEQTNIVKVLKTVLEEEIKERRESIDYIDLRFGNKVFYKFR